MLRDLPVHTRQSLYRCLDVTSEVWIESEPEITWAKYTSVRIVVDDYDVGTSVNNRRHGLFDLPSIIPHVRSSYYYWKRPRKDGPYCMGYNGTRVSILTNNNGDYYLAKNVTGQELYINKRIHGQLEYSSPVTRSDAVAFIGRQINLTGYDRWLIGELISSYL